MIEENKDLDEDKINHAKENLESVGQIIIGGLEQIGGILTGDPVTRAEGEYNAQAGRIHQESNKVLTAIDENETAENDAANQTEK